MCYLLVPDESQQPVTPAWSIPVKKIKLNEPVVVLLPDMDGCLPDPSGKTIVLGPGEYEVCDMTPYGPMVWDEPCDEDGEPTGCNWIVPDGTNWTILA